MATVLDICTRAALNIGAVQNGESLETAELTVVQAALNALLDSESIQRDSIYRASRSDRYVLTPGTQDYTLGTNATGTAGTLSATRPDFISSIDILVAGAVNTAQELTVKMRNIEDDEWQALSSRKYAADWPTAYHVDYGFPYLTLSFYSVPTVARSIDVFTGEALARTILTTDTFFLPKGYERFLVSNLALEIQPMFAGTVISPQLQKIADDSRNAVREYNRKESPRLYSANQITIGNSGTTDIRVDSMRS